MLIKIAEMRVVSSEEIPVAVLFTPEELQYLKTMPPADDIFCSVPSSWTQQRGQEWLIKKQPDIIKLRAQQARKAGPPNPKNEPKPPVPEAKLPPGVPPGSVVVMTDQQMAEWAEKALSIGPVIHAEKRPAQAELKGTFGVASPEEKK